MLVDDICSEVSGRRARKRIGRGIGSGHGKTCGRGHKGAGSRSGYKARLGFEGGQSPIFRRVAKRGQFRGGAPHHVKAINLTDIAKAFPNGGTINTNLLVEKGIVSSASVPYKVLDGGEISGKFQIVVPAISRSAASRILAAGGSVSIE
ncbi:MAG: 50S ribosomal protein L15 [Planctomycetes bacterium]|nr:50S ribosomal protein L15 [Planctomycetota bacterium]